MSKAQDKLDRLIREMYANGITIETKLSPYSEATDESNPMALLAQRVAHIEAEGVDDE
jgi:hypothetical protein